MGFFSWKTQDTNKSIANSGSGRPTFKVIMTDNKGNKWVEEDYEGYGTFGGKDYYELLAEMNGFSSERSIGIDIGCHKLDPEGNILKNVIYPSLTESGDFIEGEPDNCEYQGYFYPDDCEDKYAYSDEDIKAITKDFKFYKEDE